MKKGIALMTVIGVVTFLACNQQQEKQALSENEQQQYLKKGQKIAQASFRTLGKQLKKAMGEGGVENAIEYCNVAAYPLTDSLSKAHQVKIKRTALKLRNPQNKPTTREEKVLKEYEQRLQDNKAIKPQILLNRKGEPVFYAPIQLKPFCVNCHGDIDTEITTTNYKIIKAHYPEDEATGFRPGDLRGIWSITFHKN